MMKKILILFCFLLWTADGLIAQNSIKFTKHNLSVTGPPGGIKAENEQQICIFCHTPHRSTSVAQLWNHTTGSQTYTKYQSSTSTVNYVASFPRNASRVCLSCHDGTIALGSVYNAGEGPPGTIQMEQSGVPITSMPANSQGYLGTNLSNDHPISITTPHFNASQFNCSGCHNVHTGITKTMECTACHDPHDDSKDPITKKFLSQDNQASALCLKCHNKAYWSTNPSIHKTSTKTLPAGLSHTNYTTVADNGCENCHTPHNATSPSRLLMGVEQATCTPCHKGKANGGITEKNVSNVGDGPFAKIYRHPTYDINGKHNPVNASPPTNSPTESSIDLSPPNRHAECSDCHNPHAAKDGLHTIGSNAVSGVISGVWGLEPASTSEWTQPISFTRIDPATKEYQICLKCHSYYGLGSAPNGVTIITGPSGTDITDQAMEFNPNNHSGHPVEVSLNNLTGSYAPKALDPSQMTSDWSNTGNQTMYCSDCHGNDQPTSSTVAQGPHGSNYKFMLTGERKYWPYTASGKLWTLGDVWLNKNNWQNDLFCVNCHPLFSAGNYYNKPHSIYYHNNNNFSIDGTYYKGIPCVSCHLVIPHGGKRSRLIGYGYGATNPDVPPYIINQYTSKLRGFKKASSAWSYSQSNCSTGSGCHRGGMGGSGYDQ